MKTSFIATVALILVALFGANLAQARDRVVIIQDRGFQHDNRHYYDHGYGHRQYRHNHRRNHYHSYPRNYSHYRHYGPVVRYRGPSVVYIAPRYPHPRRW